MNLLIVLALFAQILNPLEPLQAYTTGDPISPDRLGLATPTGRYAITPMQACDWLTTDQNVLIYPRYTLPPWLVVTLLDGAPADGCMVRVEGRMSDTPCFQTDGVCDVVAELAP